MKSSEEYYNEIAKDYRHISNNRLPFLDAIDQYIIDYVKTANSYLDIGAGDGHRSLKIADGIKGKHVTLLDNSPQIASSINKDKRVELIIESIENFKSKHQYDLITCLWNVLGHVGGIKERNTFFKQVKKLLKKDGCLILDVNNRYNISHYGQKDVMNNISNDLLKVENAGWFVIGSGDNKTDVYVHAPLEIEKMAAANDLSVEKVEYVNYSTGDKMATFFEGQLLYYIKHA